MPNTVTQRTLKGSGSEMNIVRLITIVSDGSEETDLVIYDNSTLVADVTKGRLVGLKANGSAACQCLLEWDQDTDSPIYAFDPGNGVDLCFRHFGGIKNPGGTGATGDIVLTTTNLDSGDVVSIILEIEQK